MPSIELEILEPQHNAALAGSDPVRLRGRVITPSPPPLFFAWYSSLNVPSDVSQVALNFADDQELDFTTPLGVGSHVLTFTAKDVRGDALADLQAVQSAGMTGGPLIAPQPCIVHRLLATMKTPDPAGPVPNLSKAGATLEALAPAKWGDAEYQAINRMHYRWRFTPEGPPAARASADLVPAANQLTFIPAAGAAPPLVRYAGALPSTLGTGSYRLTLRVEDTTNASLRDEVSRIVNITP